jgi:hypothetical protein
MNNVEKKEKVTQTKNKDLEETDKTAISERERHKGKMNKAKNRAQATIIKARTKKQGHEAVSDQKSHEYH